MSLLETRKLFASNFLRFHGGYQLSQSTMVSYAFLPHPSSSCKCKRRERAMLNIQHSPRVQLLLVIFMDAIDLLWLLVLVQSCVLCSIEPSTELFFSDALKNWLDLTPYWKDRPRGLSTHYDVGLQNPLVYKSLRGLLWSFLHTHILMECHRTANHNVP